MGARDYRNIGHKAIYVANAWRTLEAIGWQHAEPTLRSLVLGLLDFGKSEVVNDYGLDDQSYPANVDLVAKHADALPGNWNGATANDSATHAVLDPLREGKTAAACELAMAQLRDGRCEGQAVWDAVHLAACEMMMRQRGHWRDTHGDLRERTPFRLRIYHRPANKTPDVAPRCGLDGAVPQFHEAEQR